MRKIIVKNTNGRDLRFIGELIAKAKSSSNKAVGNYSGSVGNWQELKLWKTETGKFVGQIGNMTQWSGHRDTYEAAVCNNAEEVAKFFGHGWLVDELLIDTELDVSIDANTMIA